MDYRDMGRDAVLHGDKEALRVAIIPENFLSTITLAPLLQHLNATHLHTMLLGPESGMREYTGERLSFLSSSSLHLDIPISRMIWS
ncbi:hypothetical protein B0H13DRAFT_2318298 [Mycena leptocephala]|nr:hypothetical protein B0H13DRAFT_2318298 [Mycena leptocephala]